jgi:hypothetical protein
MTTEEPGPLHLDSSAVGTIDLGPIEVPYVDLHNAPYVHKRLEINGAEYAWERSFPVKGGSAVMPDAVSALLAAGRKVLVGERSERYYIYLA